MFRNWFLTLVIFSICFLIGLREAKLKPLWGDEIYTHVQSAMNRSYEEILAGKGGGEGNQNPLYYLIHKGTVDGFNAITREAKLNARVDQDTPQSRIVARLPSLIFMSAAIAGIFLYFASAYGALWGFYSVLISLSSFMVWAYWAEGRPYALWCCLTAFQMLFWFRLMKGTKEKPASGILYPLLVLTHLLLALTISLSLIQIGAATLFLFLKERKILRTVILIVPALLIAGYYYAVAPRLGFWFKDGPLDLISANIPKDRLAILGVFALYWLVSIAGAKRPPAWRENLLQGNALHLSNTVMGFLASIFAGFGALVIYLWIGQTPDQTGFQVSNRYFMSLTPIGIFAATYCSIYLLKTPQVKWLKVLFALIVGVLVLIRLGKKFGFLSF